MRCWCVGKEWGRNIIESITALQLYSKGGERKVEGGGRVGLTGLGGNGRSMGEQRGGSRSGGAPPGAGCVVLKRWRGAGVRMEKSGWCKACQNVRVFVRVCTVQKTRRRGWVWELAAGGGGRIPPRNCVLGWGHGEVRSARGYEPHS